MTCWRCGEQIREWYVVGAPGVVGGEVRVEPADTGFTVNMETALCADCTDEMAELNAP